MTAVRAAASSWYNLTIWSLPSCQCPASSMSARHFAPSGSGAAAGGTGFHLSGSGLLLGNANDNRYFRVDYNGDVYAPNFSIVAGSATFSGVLQTAASGTRIAINEAGNNLMKCYADAGAGVQDLVVIGALSSGSVARFGNGAVGNAYPAVIAQSNSGTGLLVLSESGKGISATSTSNMGVQGVSNSNYGVIGTSTSFYGVSGGSTLSYGVTGGTGNSASYDFYALGAGINYGPFTGGHDGLLPIGVEPEQGDILVDVEIAHHANISNTVAVNALSSTPTQKNVIGVFVGQRPLNPEDPPAALKDVVGLAFMAEVYKSITMNAVGEGQINVCGEGGDIGAGDYITTSSTAGKGMRQADDILHNYTVAKAREAVTFTDPAEIKMIACTYHCG